jgi:hypothetical protein
LADASRESDDGEILSRTLDLGFAELKHHYQYAMRESRMNRKVPDLRE